MAEKKTVQMTTGVGTLSFPKVFKETASVGKDGKKTYEIQIIISKKDKKSIKEILEALRVVGEAKWGDRWKGVNSPLRDGDKEKDELAEDGKTKGEKYPERLGCFFLNARSTRPVGVYDRDNVLIDDSNEIYGGAKGKIAVEFFPYSKEGNTGIAASLLGVQKTGDGESFGASAPDVASMFTPLGDDEDGLSDDEDEKPAKAKDKAKAKGKKSKKG